MSLTDDLKAIMSPVDIPGVCLYCGSDCKMGHDFCFSCEDRRREAAQAEREDMERLFPKDES